MFRLAVTPEIELRQLEPADAEACFETVARNRASLREWLPWVDRTHSAEDIRDYIRKVAIPQRENNQGPNCGIWVRWEYAGGLGCHPIDWGNRACSLGYWLDGRFRGRGLMTQCVTALLRYLFEELKLHRVTIRCATGNNRSCAIPERLGFRQEGVELEAEWVGGRWVDLVNWGILEQEWRRSVGTPSPE
jgi:ribosomal-protein-serine acetyltransferase